MALAPGTRPGSPEVLFRRVYFNEVGSRWDVIPDGNRFLMLERVRPSSAPGGQDAPHLVLVQHWFEDLRRLVPAQ